MNFYKKIIVFFILLASIKTVAQSRIYNFNAIGLGDSIRITFTILQGTTTCAPYQILKGSDSLTLNPIYVYPGICGSTNFNETHYYTDFGPNKLTPNFYQIFIPPNDYSYVKRVDIATSFSNLFIYPQPVDDVVNIAISGQKNYYFEINIYDRFGRKKFFSSGNASDKISLDVSSFSEGVYVFYIVLGNGSAYRGKFLKKPQAY
jgi:hypothetical protein